MSIQEQTEHFDVDQLRHALEDKDIDTMLALYTDDAEYQSVSKTSPPATPHRLQGREQIRQLFHDVFNRDLTVKLGNVIVEGNHLAYEEECTYSDGNKVRSIAMAELSGGRISRQNTVEAWDE